MTGHLCPVPHLIPKFNLIFCPIDNIIYLDELYAISNSFLKAVAYFEHKCN